MIFPPQESYGPLYCNGNGDRCGVFIGCWKIDDAKKIAEELRVGGFKVRLWGRGPRRKHMESWQTHLYQYMPLRLATHAAVYVVKPRTLEIKKFGKEKIRPVVKAVPFSVKLFAIELELKELLMTIQAINPEQAVLQVDVERHVTELVALSKVYKALSINGYQQVKRPRYSDYKPIEHNRVPPQDKVVISMYEIRKKLVGDILALGSIVQGYFEGVDVLLIQIPRMNKDLYVKANHPPIGKGEKLVCVDLKDGNTAWLTEEALNLIKQQQDKP